MLILGWNRRRRFHDEHPVADLVNVSRLTVSTCHLTRAHHFFSKWGLTLQETESRSTRTDLLAHCNQRNTIYISWLGQHYLHIELCRQLGNTSVAFSHKLDKRPHQNYRCRQ